MSQHYVNTVAEGKPVTVVLGWDRPFSNFFMWIENGNTGQPDLYCSDKDVAAQAKLATTDHLKDVLKGLAIEVPAKIFEEAEKDREPNAPGNRVCRYELDGTFVSFG